MLLLLLLLVLQLLVLCKAVAVCVMRGLVWMLLGLRPGGTAAAGVLRKARRGRACRYMATCSTLPHRCARKSATGHQCVCQSCKGEQTATHNCPFMLWHGSSPSCGLMASPQQRCPPATAPANEYSCDG